MYQAPQPYPPQMEPPRQRRFSSTQLTLIIVVAIIFGSCTVCAIIGFINERLNPKSNQNANAPAPKSSPATTPTAYKYLAGINGLELGNYEKRKNSESYTCAGGERRSKLMTIHAA